MYLFCKILLNRVQLSFPNLHLNLTFAESALRPILYHNANIEMVAWLIANGVKFPPRVRNRIANELCGKDNHQSRAQFRVIRKFLQLLDDRDAVPH